MSLFPASLSRFRNPVALLRRPSISSTLLWHTVLVSTILTVAFGVVGWRIDRAPDVFTDEILYTRLGIRVASEGALVWDTGRPTVIHPPLYFVIQGMFTALTSDFEHTAYAPGDIFAAVHHARLLNGILAAVTGLVLYILGVRLKGVGLGLLFAVLFVLDPFGVRINRRAMLETLAGLFALGGMSLMLTSRENDRWPVVRAIVAGLLMGAAVLTKDLAFTTPLAVLVFGVRELLRTPTAQRRQNGAVLSAPFVAAGIAFFSYASVPLWALTTGYWDRYVRVKSLALQRLVGLVHTSGWNRPGVSLVELLMQRLEAYGTSYLLLAMGGLATVVILVLGRKTRTGRLLTVWGLVIYPLFGFVALFGSGNDQFFYFLLIPAVILLGYAVVLLVAPERRWASTQRRQIAWALGSALILILLINAALWRTTYGVTSDDGYRRLAAYVKENVPAGTQINASGDALKFRYFFPEHVVTDAGSSQEALAQGIEYFILAPKDVEARFGKITPELADWITENGMRLFMATGASYGDIHLYYVGAADGRADSAPDSADVNALSQALAPATTGFLSVFIVMLLGWIALWGVVATWLVYSQSRGSKQEVAG